MASVGLMHNLSKMMVIPYSAGDATQLEMPLSWRCHSAGDASRVRMHMYKIYKDIL